MNGHTQMPVMTFGENCDYDTLNIIRGWAAKIWLKQGVIITAVWNGTAGDYGDGDVWEDYTSLTAWSEADHDFTKPIKVPTDDITRIEVL